MTGTQALKALIEYIDACWSLELAEKNMAEAKGDEDGRREAMGRMCLIASISATADELLASVNE